MIYIINIINIYNKLINFMLKYFKFIYIINNQIEIITLFEIIR